MTSLKMKLREWKILVKETGQTMLQQQHLYSWQEGLKKIGNNRLAMFLSMNLVQVI